VNRWLDNEAKAKFEEGTLKLMPENIYVKVHGRIQLNSGKRYVVTTFVRPIEDHNEIATHLLDATYVHLQLTRGAPKAGGNKGGDDDKMDMEPSGFGASSDAKLRSVGAPARKVWHFIAKAPQGSDGVSLYEIAQGLSIEINEAQKATEELTSEALVYTTRDDETFAVLDG
jgi:replication factor A2